VFLDKKCLPYAEDWRKGFLYGLHHTKIIVPIISIGGLEHLHNAHEENDNVLLEYEHMLSLLTVRKGQVKVFPLFINEFPKIANYPDKPHVTTKNNIRKTLQGILQLQGRIIKANSLQDIIPVLLEKLDELDSGVNTSLSIGAGTSLVSPSERQLEVFIQVEGETLRRDIVEVHPTDALLFLRHKISAELDYFNFDFQFLKPGKQVAVISKKQEGNKTVQDIIDNNSHITVQRNS